MDLFLVRKKLNMGYSLKDIPLRVTIYARVSTDHIEQKKSLINQIDHFKEMIVNNKNWTLIEGYVDEGISGTSDKKRKNFLRMIDDAKQNKFDLIMTKEISRFSRNTLDSIKYTRELLSYGVAVFFLNDNINTVSSDSELRLTIMASLAQDEIRRLSERVRFGMNQAIKKETILGNNMILGYTKQDNGCLSIDNDEAMIVKKIFEWYVINKYSLNKIANELNKLNLGRKFRATSISRIISNPKYKGYYCGKRSEVVDYIEKKVKLINESDWIIYKKSEKIPVIIDEGLWNIANKRLKVRKKKKNISLQGNYLFTGKLVCQNDNCYFQRRIHCKNDITWLCANYLRNGKNSCHSPNIRESELKTILKIITSKIDINGISNMLFKIYSDNSNINNYEDENKKIKRKCDKLINLYLDGGINKEEYLRKRKDYLEKLEIINKKYDQKKIIVNNNLRDKIAMLFNRCDVIDKIIDIIIKKIIVSNNDKIITLRIFLSVNERELEELNGFFSDKLFGFKRGYNVISTKRYEVFYMVMCVKFEE